MQPALTAAPLLRRIKRHTLWLLLAFFIAVFYFASHNLAEKREQLYDARLLRTWTEAGIDLNQLLHELQKERGLSAGFIASDGTRFNRELREQALLTDRAVSSLRESWRQPPPHADPLADRIEQVLLALEGLSELRTTITEHGIDHDAAFDRYSRLIAPLFEHLAATAGVGRTGWVLRQQVAFIAFIQAKEMAAQARGLLTVILSGHFSPRRTALLADIQAMKQAHQDKFLQLSDPQTAAEYRSILTGPHSAEAERIHRFIFAEGDHDQPVASLVVPQAERWFELATHQIDALHQFEPVLSGQLLNRAQALEQEALRNLMVNAAGMLASLLLAGGLLLQLRRGRMLAEEDLRLAATVFDNAVESIVITDAQANIVEVNQAFTRVTGYQRREVLGKNPRILQSGRQDREFYRAMWDKLLRVGHWQGDIWNRRKNGALYPALQSIFAIKGSIGETSHYVAMNFDLSKFKETEALVDRLRTFDPLTGLLNRDAWHSAVDQALARAQREGGGFALLELGLDRFKIINESLGHAVGDAVLVGAAGNISRLLRRRDMVARSGGDRFSILLTDLSDLDDVAAFCEQMLAAFAQPFQVHDHRLYVTTSIGVALFPSDGKDIRTLLRNAEVALHNAKDGGRNRYKFYSVKMNAAGVQQLALEHLLRRAVESEEFSIVYQPQVDARHGQLRGFEALLRWQTSEQGTVSPAQFIPIAEATGLIVPIGAWVLSQACRQACHWREALGLDLPVAVNLSARQFHREDLLQVVQQVLSDTGLPAGLLELEITEGLLMEDPAAATGILGGLREMGVKVAVDDFGTGYSSLAYLKNFPLDRLKLDRAFVRDLPDNVSDRTIARTVIALGHSLGLEVLAEGVETAEQADFLTAAGCDAFQGYYFGRPLPADQLEAQIRAGTLPLQRHARQPVPAPVLIQT